MTTWLSGTLVRTTGEEDNEEQHSGLVLGDTTAEELAKHQLFGGFSPGPDQEPQIAMAT